MGNEQEVDWLQLSERWARRCGWREITPEKPFFRENGWSRWTQGWTNGVEARDPRWPEFENSVDALLASLPQGWYPRIETDARWSGQGRWEVVIFSTTGHYLSEENGTGDTAAHALLLACLAVPTEEKDAV